jgi:hypothetical protein
MSVDAAGGREGVEVKMGEVMIGAPEARGRSYRCCSPFLARSEVLFFESVIEVGCCYSHDRENLRMGRRRHLWLSVARSQVAMVYVLAVGG